MELQVNANEDRLNELSEKIIGAAFEVSNVLGITGLKLCLLINFSEPRVQIKRIVNDI